MAKTKIDLANSVALKLGVIAPGSPLPADDGEFIRDYYTDILEEWKDRGIAYWASDQIPVVVFHAVVLIVSGNLANDFGMSEPEESDESGIKYPISALGFRKLRRHLAKPASGEQFTAEFF